MGIEGRRRSLNPGSKGRPAGEGMLCRGCLLARKGVGSPGVVGEGHVCRLLACLRVPGDYLAGQVVAMVAFLRSRRWWPISISVGLWAGKRPASGECLDAAAIRYQPRAASTVQIRATGHRFRYRSERKSHGSWLEHISRFRIDCSMAGLDPDDMRENMQENLIMHVWRRVNRYVRTEVWKDAEGEKRKKPIPPSASRQVPCAEAKSKWPRDI